MPAELSIAHLVDRVAARTSGTRGDPLDRAEVEQVVAATLLELEAADAGSIAGMSETPETPTPEPTEPEVPTPAPVPDEPEPQPDE